MINFNIKLADVLIGITCNYEDTKKLCENYIVQDENPEFCVSSNMEDIEFERQKSIREARYEGIPVYDYENGYLETLAIYRKIAVKMLDYNTCVFHGAAIALNNEAYLFTAKSGTGKTTHVDLWLKQFKGSYIVNGDKPLLKINEDSVYVCGTPWAGKEAFNTNCIVPLKAICILERDVTNHIEKINYKDAFDMLVQQIYRPSDIEGIKKTLNLVSMLGKGVSIYKLGCNMEEEAAIVSYNGMNQ